MRTSLLAAATAAALSFGIVAVEAAPIVIAAPAAVAPPVVLVAGGCGLGFHRGLYGRCIPNVLVRRVVAVYPCVRRWTLFGWRRVCR